MALFEKQQQNQEPASSGTEGGLNPTVCPGLLLGVILNLNNTVTTGYNSQSLHTS